MTQRLTTLQVQRPILAPLMQRSVTILMLSINELDTAIETELQDNPLLEVDETAQLSIPTPKEEVHKIDFQRLSKIWEEPIYTDTSSDVNEEDDIRQNRFKKEVTLEESLLRQLHVELRNPEEVKIGEFIIGNLDESGYLTISCPEIAQRLEVDSLQVQKVLDVIQNFEPLGIASINVQECLLTQIHFKDFVNSSLMEKIIVSHFNDLGRKKFNEIARKIGVSEDAIREAAKNISSLEPKPARNFRPIDFTIYVKPDVTVRKDDRGFQVILNDEWIPPLRVNRYYHDLLKRPNLSEQEREFIQTKFENAVNFIRSIKQRGETLLKIVRFIIERQKEFFNDQYSALLPLTLKEVALAIDRGESTISRAIRGKFVDTPHGVYPLKFFFSSAISTENNGDIGSRTIKEDLKEMIGQENKSSPFSDQEIVTRFSQKGVKLARRTVAKYRLELNIPPSHLRKE